MSSPLLFLPRGTDPTATAVRVSWPSLPVQAMEPGARSHGQLLGVVAGLLSVDTGDSRWVVPPGHALWVPPHRLQAAVPHGAQAGWRVQVAQAACADLPNAACTVVVSGLLREAVARAATWPDGPSGAAPWRVVGVILDEIAARTDSPLLPFALPLPLQPRLAGVATAMLDDLADSRGLDAWAAQAGMAARTLTRHFATETGFSLVDWRQRARLHHALERLAGGEAVAPVAAHLGYENVSAFIAMFRRALGVTPARFFAPH